jgi:hypothetical protein
MDKAHQRRFELLGIAVLLTAWGGAGLLTRRSGYTDALYEPDYTIQQVPRGSALAEAGFQVGDTVVAVEGIPIQELGMYSRWPRSLSRRPGDLLAMTVRRDGALWEGVVIYRDPPPNTLRNRRVTALFTQAFLWLGIWILFTTPGAHAGRFAVLGLVAGLALPGPGLGTLTGFRDHLEVAGKILFLTILFHFLLLFPRAKRPAKSRWIGLIYLPWVGLLVTQAIELVMHPRLYHTFGGYIGLLFSGFLLASVVALIHTAATAPRDERRQAGVGFMVAGWAVALVPSLVALAGWIIPPGWDTPGQRYFPYLLVAIPLGMALAVRREAVGRAAEKAAAAN